MFFEHPGGRPYNGLPVGDRERETSIGGEGRSFPSTLWSVVIQAKDAGSPLRQEALGKLIETYWKPLYAFLRRKGNDVEASKDLVQGFFAELLGKDTLKYLDRDRGRFRTFLLTALDHYMKDEIDRTKAKKRGGGRLLLSLDVQGVEAEISAADGGRETPDERFVRDWALQVMAQALEAVRADFEASGRKAEFEAFRQHLASTHPEGASYEEMAGALGCSVEDVRNRIRKSRAAYRDAILQVIRSYTETDAEAREEFLDLMAAFS